MLTGIRVGNFKAFGQAQSVPIKPITLIFGPNSGGKSSIIHSLLLLSHAIETGDFDVHRTDLGSESVDLGGFKQFIHKRQLDGKLELGIEIDAADLYTPAPLSVRDGQALPMQELQDRKSLSDHHDELCVLFGKASTVGLSLVVDLALDDTGTPREGASPSIRSLELLIDGKGEMKMSSRGGTALRLDRFEPDRLAFEQCLFQRLQGDTSEGSAQLRMSEVAKVVMPELLFNLNPLIPSGRVRYGSIRVWAPLVPLEVSTSPEESTFTSLEFRAYVRETIALFELLWQALDDAFRDLLRDVRYIGPLRSYVPRQISSWQRPGKTWHPDGGSAWEIVRTNAQVRAQVNAWLGDAQHMKTPYELVLRTFVAQTQLEATLKTALYAGLPEDEDDYDYGAEAAIEDVQATWRGLQSDLEKASELRTNTKIAAAWMLAHNLSNDETMAAQDAANKAKVDWRAKQDESDAVAAEVYELQREAAESQDPEGYNGHDDLLANFPSTPDELDGYVGHVWDAVRSAAIERVEELVLRDRRIETIVSHRDVGVGVSQVLPVLVSAYAQSQSTIIIEQPELHLHPALQTELADVFIHSALGERHNTFILETHSEHLILRLMRRLRDTSNGTLPPGMPSVRPEDLAILYVEPIGDTSIVRTLLVDDDGELLSPWPGGFFEEGFHERFA